MREHIPGAVIVGPFDASAGDTQSGDRVGGSMVRGISVVRRGAPLQGFGGPGRDGVRAGRGAPAPQPGARGPVASPGPLESVGKILTDQRIRILMLASPSRRILRPPRVGRFPQAQRPSAD